MLIGADDKNTKRIFTETNMLEILKCIKISQSCDVDVVNVKNDTWKEYTQKQLSLIIERGERIINYRMSVLSPDIYYAIVYLVHESVTIFALNGILGTPRLLENFGKNPTLYYLLPSNRNSEKSIELDAEYIRKLIQWVNQEYDYLTEQKNIRIDHIYKINLTS